MSLIFKLSNIPIWWNCGGTQGIFLLLRNDFKIDQYVLVLVRRFIILSEIREKYFSLLASIKDFNSFWNYSTLLNNLGSLLLWRKHWKLSFFSLISSLTLLLIQVGSRSSQMIISCGMWFERIFFMVLLNKNTISLIWHMLVDGDSLNEVRDKRPTP